jgi:hypothetical protein
MISSIREHSEEISQKKMLIQTIYHLIKKWIYHILSSQMINQSSQQFKSITYSVNIRTMRTFRFLQTIHFYKISNLETQR